LTERKMDPGAAYSAIKGSNGKYVNYDIAMWAWQPPVDPNFILGVMTCNEWDNNSDSGYCNPNYDKLFSDQSGFLSPKARHKLINKMQNIAYNSRAYIVIDYPKTLEAHSSKWVGFVPSPLIGSVNNLSPLTLINVHKRKIIYDKR
jgi:peptide/nickel transport system substrate-binding protein